MMQKLRRLIALMIAAILTVPLTALAAAACTGFTDVAADAWYAGAVAYCQTHDLMECTGSGMFELESTMT